MGPRLDEGWRLMLSPRSARRSGLACPGSGESDLGPTQIDVVGEELDPVGHGPGGEVTRRSRQVGTGSRPWAAVS